MIQAKRILVPIDFSPLSDLALDWAIRLAKDERDAMLMLLHVLPGMTAPVGPETIAFDYSDYFKTEKVAVEEKLKILQERIPRSIFSHFEVGRGFIAQEIEQVCQKELIDLVIMTTHGRRGLSHLLQGSATEETVRLAPCPVLVLHLNNVAQEVAQKAARGA